MSKDYYSECEQANHPQIYVAHHWMRDEFLHRISYAKQKILGNHDESNGTILITFLRGSLDICIHSIGVCIALAFTVHKVN